MKVKGKHIVLSFVLLVTGFIVALSYELTSERASSLLPGYERQWEHEDTLRQEVMIESEKNKQLQEQLQRLQANVRELEEEIASVTHEQEVRANNILEDVDRLRKIVGQVKVKGPGIEVSLEDAEYFPDGENPNNYIVHEQHIQSVIDELLVAGAEAIAINGQRITNQSYIQCIGPVIMIDGYSYPAPFTISAIGDSSHLESALLLYGGVHHQLVAEGITVRIQPKDTITLNPHLSESG